MSTSHYARGRVAVTADDPGHRTLIALLMAVVLSTGLFGFGHHHADSEWLDEHQCFWCHLHQTVIKPAEADPGVPAVEPPGRVSVSEPEPTHSLTSRLSSPPRGPPQI